MTLRSVIILLGVGLSLLIFTGRAAVIGGETKSAGSSGDLSSSSDSTKDYTASAATQAEGDREELKPTNIAALESRESEAQLELRPADSIPRIEIAPDITDKDLSYDTHKIEATIINPFRSAAIATEVTGIIEGNRSPGGVSRPPQFGLC